MTKRITKQDALDFYHFIADAISEGHHENHPDKFAFFAACLEVYEEMSYDNETESTYDDDQGQ